MIQTASKSEIMTLDEFLDWYPDGYGYFELHSGVIIEMQPTGSHKQGVGWVEEGILWLCENLVTFNPTDIY
jgi:Uma2 family endonuclease